MTSAGVLQALREEIILELDKQPASAANLFHQLGIDKDNNAKAKDYAKVMCSLEEEGVIHLPDYGEAELSEVGKIEAVQIKKAKLVTV